VKHVGSVAALKLIYIAWINPALRWLHLAPGIGKRCIRISILAFDLPLMIVEIYSHIEILESVSGLEESLLLWSIQVAWPSFLLRGELFNLYLRCF
jgi:hypothetical protein